LSWTLAFRRCLADRRGAVAIEFAAIALPFILLLAGTMEISRYTWTRVALQDVASAGARCLGLGPRQVSDCFDGDSMNTEKTKGFVRQQGMVWGIRIDPSAITPEQSGDCNGIGGSAKFAKVEILHTFTSVLPALPDSEINVEACFPAAPSV
jgi:hypothetical protein